MFFANAMVNILCIVVSSRVINLFTPDTGEIINVVDVDNIPTFAEGNSVNIVIRGTSCTINDSVHGTITEEHDSFSIIGVVMVVNTLFNGDTEYVIEYRKH